MTAPERLLGPDPPRVLIVVAHQDDETIGAGALISHLPDCWILHVTDGAARESRFIEGFSGSREEYAAARWRELVAALGAAGVGPERQRRVEGVVDQDACFAMPRLAREVVRHCRELRPGVVLTLAYEGGHPDHDAAAFAVHAAAARCVMVPSQIAEACPLVALEALACGTPVVASRLGALPEIVDPGRTGFLASTVPEMAEALRRVESLDAAECRREAERRFSAEVMTERYLDLYSRLCLQKIPGA